jgi:hypothetical protein
MNDNPTDEEDAMANDNTTSGIKFVTASDMIGTLKGYTIQASEPQPANTLTIPHISNLQLRTEVSDHNLRVRIGVLEEERAQQEKQILYYVERLKQYQDALADVGKKLGESQMNSNRHYKEMLAVLDAFRAYRNAHEGSAPTVATKPAAKYQRCPACAALFKP